MSSKPLKKLDPVKLFTDPMAQADIAKDSLFPSQRRNPPPMPDVPTREDAITSVLSQQLETIKKRRGQTGTGGQQRTNAALGAVLREGRWRAGAGAARKRWNEGTEGQCCLCVGETGR